VVVRDIDALIRFTRKEFPNGFAPIVPDGTPSRARSILLTRDAKRAKRCDTLPILVRAFKPAIMHCREEHLDVYALTRTAGIAAILVEQPCAWQFDGVVALVENLEVFLHVERILDTIDIVIFAGGRLSDLARAWLTSPVMASAQYIHLGDYDPVGLDEYLKLDNACPGRTTLHVPKDFEERLRRFGKPALLADSIAVLDRLRRAANPKISEIIRTLDRYGCGLEQEALLLPVEMALALPK
jgi:hypothetical protein